MKDDDGRSRTFDGDPPTVESSAVRSGDPNVATGKPVVVNLSNLWWYERGPFRALYQEAANRADGLLFESGGAWRFGELSDKLIFMGERTPLVYLEQ